MQVDTPLFTALLSYSARSPVTLLLDDSGGPGPDATFLLYHRARAALLSEPPAPVAFLALGRPAAHHRAALRKFLGPLEPRVGVVCGWEVAAAAAAGGGPAALAAALLAAAGLAAGGGGGGAAAGLLLCVDDALGVCELAGGIGEGLATLQLLAAAAVAAPPAALCVRLPARCDWRVPEGGPLLAPSLSSRLRALAGAVLTARDLASGWSADAHGSLEAARGGGGAPAGEPPGAGALLLYRVAPDGSVREIGQRSRG
jgi:hypothetical protein